MSDKFNCNNADVTFKSADGVDFHLHRSLLEAHTGAFPGPSIDTRGEVVQLQEPAKVLEILFDFVYPKRHLDLVDTDIELLFDVAEAVEKYEVFSAMFVCNARLSALLPRYAERILAHAVKHNYPKLIDEATPHIARSSSVSAMQKLPVCYSLPWFRYQESWASLFRGARRYTKNMPLLQLADGRKEHRTCHSAPGTICNTCQNSMFLWIATLEEIETISALNEVLDQFPTAISNASCCKDSGPVTATDWAAANMMTYGSGRPTSGSPQYKCNHLLNLARSMQYQIKAIPLFSDFVNGQYLDKTKRVKQEE
uniref:BTB domain-containing protein n=1 Tax=Psilocybe cubensis TaxID=181762 RepID=A0A8H7XT37_PSICU